jgi:hypothetical protein
LHELWPLPKEINLGRKREINLMRTKTVGNKGDDICIVFLNDDTIAIPIGAPVIARINDSVKATGSITAGAFMSTYAVYGVCIAPTNVSGGCPVNGYGEAQAYGFCNQLNLTLQTRAGTSGASSWPSLAAISTGVFLIPETVANGWTTLASTLAGASYTATAGFMPIALLAASVAIQAASATTTSDTRTAVQIAVKAFLRMI